MLSNTATPKYYGIFRDRVLNGEIPVCETISLEMNRINDLIKNPGVFYDPVPVEAWIDFCENELTLTDGAPFAMLDSFKLWGEQVYGWYYYVYTKVYVPYPTGRGGRYLTKRKKRRLVKKQYLIISRGNAKTVYDVCHQSYGLVVDTESTHQIATAPTMKMAEEMMLPFQTALAKSRGPLLKFLTEGSINNTTGLRSNRPKLSTTKKGIENFLTNSVYEILPMRIDKLQGLQNKYSTVDEWLSCDINEDVIGALEQGASKLPNYLIIASSSEGTVRNGPGDDIKLELMSILKGEYENPYVSIFWYKMDSIKEISNPDLWEKANPNIGKTVSYEAIQADVERAEKVPSARNDILAKRFGIPMEGYTYYFTYEETLPHRRREMWNMPCSLGIDLSQGDDFCGFTFLFPLRDGKFGIKVRSYITERTFSFLPTALSLKYEEFIKEGTLIVMDGTILNMMAVYEDLDQFTVNSNYEVQCVGYDPYNAKEFMERYERENGPYGIVKVPQGVKTESVPLGELKKLAEDRMLLFDEALMSFCMGNCIALEDNNGNRKLYKKRREEKIDNVAAMLDAYVAFKVNLEMF